MPVRFSQKVPVTFSWLLDFARNFATSQPISTKLPVFTLFPSKPNRSDPARNRLPQRLAWATVCGTFLLLAIGALVTSYQAGMSVPDWPTTYGYLLLYPPARWLGVWDVFLEHSHRLVGFLVIVLTVVLAAVLWRQEGRRAVRWLGPVMVAAIGLQEVLGGLRVLWDEILLAKVHDCTAVVFFALCAALVTFTSAPWLARRGQRPQRRGRLLRGLAPAVSLGVYAQIVLGVQLRHLPPGGSVGWFALWVWLHLIAAGLVVLGSVWLFVLVVRGLQDEPMLVRRAKWLVALLAVQLVLGAGSWVTNFGWPAWFYDWIWAIEYTVVAEGRLQVATNTTHALLGPLVLTSSLSLALWSWRLVGVKR